LQLKQAPSAKLDQIEATVQSTPTPTPTTSTTATPAKKSLRVTNLSLKEKFVCRPMDLIQCFIEPNRVRAYAGGDSTITGEKGGKFSLFGGAVQGEITELVGYVRSQFLIKYRTYPKKLFKNGASQAGQLITIQQ
jgi:activator of HSP90 ATPase